jgi:hypothetical protein
MAFELPGLVPNSWAIMSFATENGAFKFGKLDINFVQHSIPAHQTTARGTFLL